MPGRNRVVAIVHEIRLGELITHRLALDDFIAFAPDALHPLGGYPGDDYKGGLLFAKLDAAKRTQDLLAAAMWLKAHPAVTGKIGVTGFCFGGGISNYLAVRMGGDLAAAVPYYGGGILDNADIEPKVPVMAHFGEKDSMIPVDGVRKLAEKHKKHQVFIYAADHGFNCDQRASFNPEASALADAMTRAFFERHIR